MVKNIENNYKRDTFIGSAREDDVYGVIYKLTDTNKDGFLQKKMVYIGRTIQHLHKRFRQHLTDPSNKFLKQAINRYNKKLKITSTSNNHKKTTSGGEFVIEVIKYCKNYDDLVRSERLNIAKYKSCVLDYYTIINGKNIPIYGYNANRGEHIFSFYPYKSNTDQIDDEIFIDLICQGFFGTEIIEELGIGEKMLYLKLKALKYRGLMQAREELGVMDIFKNRLKLHPSRNRQANGVLDLQISEKAKMVKNAIESKMETTDIAQKYGFVNRKDVHKFIKDTWNITYRQAERLFRIYPKIDKNIFLKLVSDGLTIRDIDKEILKYLIYSGLSSKEVSIYLEKANPNDKHQMSDWVEFVFGEEFFSQRTEYQKKWLILMDVFFWKPRIEELIEKCFDSMQIEKEIYNITWQKSPKAKNIHSKIKRIWNDEYNSIISIQKKYKYFFDYLRRIYMVYPRYNAQLLDKLREKKETPLKIDREMTKFIIFKGNKSKLPYSSKELVNIFSFSSKISSVNTQSSKYVRLFFHDIFGMNMFDINRQFYWKPRIIKFFKSGFANCGDFFNHPLFKRCYKREDNLHKHFTKIFKKEFKEIIKIYPNSRQKKKKFFELLVQKYS